MACTTILVGREASFDGSTMIARNDDSGAGSFTPKRFAVFEARKEASVYRSVISKAEIPLEANAMRFTAVPNAVIEKEGIWGASGVNEANVAMTATETITSNPRVLGADPLVQEGSIGEEDIVSLVLPYIHSAREGVARLGMLLEKYGTYEKNGIAFQDVNEIWWLETIGGHHWIARKVPDDAYVIMANQFGMDAFDLDDALGEQRHFMCSTDLREFIEDNHLDLSLNGEFSARDAFGSHEDADHVYNTPRVWYTLRYFNLHSRRWDGADAEFTPVSDDLPWCMIPEKKITVEDVKYVLSSHYQGTPYDPYSKTGDKKGIYRAIGINRTDFMSLIQLRGEASQGNLAIQWLAFASNAFNVLVPFYANVTKVPEYLANTTETVSTDNFYWTSRLIGAMADASYHSSAIHIERWQLAVHAKGHEIVKRYDALLANETDSERIWALCEQANEETAAMLKEETNAVLKKVLDTRSNEMKNGFSRADG